MQTKFDGSSPKPNCYFSHLSISLEKRDHLGTTFTNDVFNMW